MRQTLRGFLADEGASATVEYGMVAATIALVAIIVLSQVGINFKTVFQLLRTISTGTQG